MCYIFNELLFKRNILVSKTTFFFHLPTGFLSKKLIGALKIVLNIESCKFVDAEDVIAKNIRERKAPIKTTPQKKPM